MDKEVRKLYNNNHDPEYMLFHRVAKWFLAVTIILVLTYSLSRWLNGNTEMTKDLLKFVIGAACLTFISEVVATC
jgi:hypothetical protein